MSSLQDALKKFSQTLPSQTIGAAIQQNSDGQLNVQNSNGGGSLGTGMALTQREVEGKGTGGEHGKTTAIAKPESRGAALNLVEAQPDKAALAAVTSWLPPSVEHWLNLLENSPRDLEGRHLTVIPQPELTAEVRDGLKQCLWTLRQTTRPSRERMEELMEMIQTLLTGFKWRTFGGEENVSMNLKVWCEAVGDFPLYAVGKAVRWSVMGEKKEPSIAKFASDVRLACGHNVLERKRMLERL